MKKIILTSVLAIACCYYSYGQGTAAYVTSHDTRSVNDLPQDFSALVKFDFKSNTTNNLSDGGTYNGVMTFRSYGTGADFTGGPAIQLAYTNSGNLWTRTSASASTWGTWIKILNSNTGVQLQASTPATVQTGNINISGTALFGANVGIGTTNLQGYMLAVNGSAIATSMIVKLHSNWPDYVFKKDYRLPSLQEVKTYIDQNHHLPEVPSEQQVAKDGLNLGEMNKILTKKVEELTLYLIEKDKQINEQQKVNQSVQQQLNDLVKQLKDLKSVKTTGSKQ